MRLLHAKTRKLDSFAEEQVPKYVILSHTWGAEEVTLQDLQNDPSGITAKAGWIKIAGFCDALLSNQDYSLVQYVWVDTCCIDKTSSAELQEAINSMYRWYKNSECCMVYLEDVPPSVSFANHRRALGKSRWFSRGWTLQEVLAPDVVIFYDAAWQQIGDLNTYDAARTVISEATGVPSWYLPFGGHSAAAQVKKASIAQRLSWAASRQTTRSEDRAYSLMGIMDANMPMLYGEGDAAFLRLQTELIKSSADQSFLAYGFGMSLDPNMCATVLAKSPAFFQGCRAVKNNVWTSEEDLLPFDLTNTGLRITMPLIRHQHTTIAFLRCSLGKGVIAIPLQKSQTGKNGYTRTLGGLPTLVSRSLMSLATLEDIFLQDYVPENYVLSSPSTHVTCTLEMPVLGCTLVEVYPPCALRQLTSMANHPYYKDSVNPFVATFDCHVGDGFMFAVRFEENSPTEVPTGTRILFRIEGQTPPFSDGATSHDEVRPGMTKVAVLTVRDGPPTVHEGKDEIYSLLDYETRRALVPDSQDQSNWYDSITIANQRISLKIRGEPFSGNCGWELRIVNELLERQPDDPRGGPFVINAA